MEHITPNRPPALDPNASTIEVEVALRLTPSQVYRAWTIGFDWWFAAPGSVHMTPEVNAPFFFETEFLLDEGVPAERHPHYGRFLALDPHRRIEMTWVTGPAGTQGVETVVTLTLEPIAEGTRVRLCHAGFLDPDAAERTRLVWPYVLRQMEARLAERFAPTNGEPE